MAYITSESVKEMRNSIKALYPAKQGWKFSITREHYSNVRCEILTAPVELRVDTTKENEGVNNFWIESRFEGKNEIATEILKNINDILNLNNFDKSDSMTDYFHVGHYVTLTIGSWDKPFKLVN
jgi:hypothetical protein